MVYIGAVIECYSSCVHGICEIINNTYTCDCFQGWTGSYCDQGNVIQSLIEYRQKIEILVT